MHCGAQTSRLAHAAVRSMKRQVWTRILAFAAQRGVHGFTADELSAAWTCSPNHVAPRITELLQAGKLVATRRTRPTRSGSSARVLVAFAYRRQPTPATTPAQSRCLSAAPQPALALFSGVEGSIAVGSGATCEESSRDQQARMRQSRGPR